MPKPQTGKKPKQAALITPTGIASYAFVWRPQPSMTAGQDPKYAITLILSKKVDISKLKAAVTQAAIRKFGDTAQKLIRLNKIKLPFRDGDEEREDDDLYAGKIFFAAKSSNAPQIVGTEIDEETGKLRVITDQTEFYSGAKCRLSVWPYGYDVNGNKGVAFGLNNIQKMGDGERLSGRRDAEDEFGDEEESLADDEDLM